MNSNKNLKYNKDKLYKKIIIIFKIKIMERENKLRFLMESTIKVIFIIYIYISKL